MRVLDIDLDFFLADCCPLAAKGERPALSGCEPWPREEVIRFLTEQCGLKDTKPVAGAVFETHDGALYFWDKMRKDGRLTVPFHVTHVDAHSDLGIGYPGPGYVLNTVLAQPQTVRTDIRRHTAAGELDEANYLLFALAFRWVSSLENVRNSKSRKDFPEQLFVPGRTDRIRLNSFTSRLFEKKNGCEPDITYREYQDYHLFHTDEPYDFMTLAMSPRYAPREADALKETVMSFIRI